VNATHTFQHSHFLVPGTGAGPAGEVATCVELAAKGGITFEVKRGASLQPFAGAKALQFDLRPGAPPPAPAGANVRERVGRLLLFASFGVRSHLGVYERLLRHTNFSPCNP
jgi:hypothetical protein